MRIAFIGAGSVGFTQKLVRDILTVPELQETEFSSKISLKIILRW